MTAPGPQFCSIDWAGCPVAIEHQWIGTGPSDGPLLVFLHGSGERGDDLDRVKFHGPPKHVAAGRRYPFILCSPQLDAGSWKPDTLHALRAALQARESI